MHYPRLLVLDLVVVFDLVPTRSSPTSSNEIAAAVSQKRTPRRCRNQPSRPTSHRPYTKTHSPRQRRCHNSHSGDGHPYLTDYKNGSWFRFRRRRPNSAWTASRYRTPTDGPRRFFMEHKLILGEAAARGSPVSGRGGGRGAGGASEADPEEAGPFASGWRPTLKQEPEFRERCAPTRSPPRWCAR